MIKHITSRKDKKLVKKQEGQFYGAGDIFVSVLCGKIVANKSFEEAFIKAVNFVNLCIEQEGSDKVWYGIAFEKHLAELIENE